MMIEAIREHRATMQQALYPTYCSSPQVQKTPVALLAAAFLACAAVVVVDIVATQGSGSLAHAFTHFAANVNQLAHQTGHYVGSSQDAAGRGVAVGVSLLAGAGLAGTGAYRLATWSQSDAVTRVTDLVERDVQAAARLTHRTGSRPVLMRETVSIFNFLTTYNKEG